MRLCVFANVAVLVLVSLTAAQERPLGDVGREARKEREKSAPAKKVITNEDSEPKAINAEDDPVEVVRNALVALQRDHGHRCSLESSGNSGPGHAQVVVAEVEGPDRMHAVISQSRPEQKQDEWIILGNDGYYKADGSPWKKLAGESAGRGTAAYLPQELIFNYQQGDLKLVGKSAIDGVPTLQYQFAVHSNGLDRTADLWIGMYDNLPRRTHMHTSDRMGDSAPLIWEETFSCTYGVQMDIKPPM